jgi:hypothetical protein
MSAAKRRIKRKIKLLVRMDDTRSRMRNLPCADGERPQAYWHACMMPLAAKITAMGYAERGREAILNGAAHRVYTGGNP